MTIKQHGGIFGRNPTLNDVTIEGDITLDGTAIPDPSTILVDGDIGSTVQGYDADTAKLDVAQTFTAAQTFDENIVMANGKGIDFSATAGTGTSELFDDYEEGTWTAVLSDGTNNATMNVDECYYTKIGRQVTLTGKVSTSALGSVTGTQLRINGMPFSNGPKGVGAAVGRAGGLAITAGHVPTLYIDASSSAIRLGLFDNAGGVTTLQAAEWTDDGSIDFSITYTAA